MSLKALRRLDAMFDQFAKLVIERGQYLATADYVAVMAKLHEMDSCLAAALEVEEQLAEQPARKAKRSPSLGETYARGVLRNAITRVEAAKGSTATLAHEARTLTTAVRAGMLDGALARRALVDAARVAGIDPDEIDRVLAAVARERTAA